MRMFRLAIAITSVVSLTACAGNTLIPDPNPSAKPGLLSAGVSPSSETPKKSEFNPFRDESETSSHSQRQIITNPTISQVMLPGPLPEMAIGRADAPVTIVKYASLTCPFCRKFQFETFPELKREYIDTGKVRFILREFPIGFQSGAATIALRCAPTPSYFPLYTDLLRHQRVWVSQEVRYDPIYSIAKKHGITRPQFDACITDETLIQNLKWVKDRGRTLGVIGTPNFFVNGKLYKRVLTMTDLHKLVADGRANQVASTKKP